MKKYSSLILSIAIIVISLCSCNTSNVTVSNVSDEVIIEEIVIDQTSSVISGIDTSDVSNESQQTESTLKETETQNTTLVCQHKYEEKIIVKAEIFKMGEKQYVCTACGDKYTEQYPIEKIKILSISNSYGKNALWKLYDICKTEGVKEIDIAVMYIAGCSLDKHWENIQNNNAEYEVFRNNNGTWTSTQNCTIDSLLEEGNWDVITTQNSSGLSGKTDGYNNLNNVADYIKSKCPNSKLVWHQIWGYQSGSKWLTPNNYNGDEKLMYQSIVDCTNNIVVPSGNFDSVAPVGAAIMNARTSSLKNTVHDADGSHLSENFGYDIAAFTWYCHLTGVAPYDTLFAAVNTLSADKVNVAVESVKNAIENPYKVTQSYYTN